MSKHLYYFWLVVWAVLACFALNYSIAGQSLLINWLFVAFIMPIIVFFNTPYYQSQRLLQNAIIRKGNKLILTNFWLCKQTIDLEDVYLVAIEETHLVIELKDSGFITLHLIEDLGAMQKRYLNRVFKPVAVCWQEHYTFA